MNMPTSPEGRVQYCIEAGIIKLPSTSMPPDFMLLNIEAATEGARFIEGAQLGATVGATCDPQLGQPV